MTGPEREARVKLLTLREYRKADGGTYFKGWLGDSTVLVFRDDRAEPDYGAEAVWSVFVTPKRPKPDQGNGTSTAPSSPDRPRRPPSRHTNHQAPIDRSPPTGGPLDDDDMPF